MSERDRNELIGEILLKISILGHRREDLLTVQHWIDQGYFIEQVEALTRDTSALA